MKPSDGGECLECGGKLDKDNVCDCEPSDNRESTNFDNLDNTHSEFTKLRYSLRQFVYFILVGFAVMILYVRFSS